MLFRPSIRLVSHAGLAVVVALAGVICIGWSLPSGAAMAKQVGKKHDFKKQVEALEVQWRDAQLSGDLATMDKMLSDDYVGISMTGQVNTKEQQLNRLRTRKISLTKMDLEDVSVKLIGLAVAVVTSRVAVEGINEGAQIKGIYRYTRVYQRIPAGGWKITNFEATRISPNPSAEKTAVKQPRD